MSVTMTNFYGEVQNEEILHILGALNREDSFKESHWTSLISQMDRDYHQMENNQKVIFLILVGTTAHSIRKKLHFAEYKC